MNMQYPPILPDQRFGKLTVIEKDPLSKRYKGKLRLKWRCRCDCGNFSSTHDASLKRGRTRSCGCSRAEWHKNHQNIKSHNWKGYRDISGICWATIKYNAKKRKINFDITIEEAWNLLAKQDFRCALTNEKLILAKTKEEKQTGVQTASLDRIDSSKSYTIDNVQWVHKWINLMKLEMTNSEFIGWCHKVKKYNAS